MNSILATDWEKTDEGVHINLELSDDGNERGFGGELNDYDGMLQGLFYDRSRIYGLAGGPCGRLSVRW